MKSTPAPSSYQLAVLRGLQSRQSLFGGVQNPGKVTQRRAANRAARRSRQVNRRRSK